MNKLSSNLKKLLFAKNLKPTGLSKLTNVSQPTIQRIVSGTSARPHVSSLQPIAEYFSISVEQLLGEKPISFLEESEKLDLDVASKVKHIPLLSWSQVDEWLEKHTEVTDYEQYVYIDKTADDHAFALRTKDASMEPLFPTGTLLIFDPKKSYADRGYVLVKLAETNNLIFRQLLLDGADKFIKPLSPDLTNSSMHLLSEKDQICGVLLQARYDPGD